MKIYNKLVRDRILEMIEADHKNCITRKVEGHELRNLLEEKMIEEFNEYLEDRNLEELADMLEVLIGLAKYHGYTEEELMHIRMKKYQARGGFEEGVFLESVTIKKESW